MMIRSRIGVLASALTVSLPAFAQQPPTTRGLEEIIVTAQKVEQSITDVPIAVSAFGGEALEAQNIDTAIDLQNYVPNINYTGTGDFSIRGVGAAVGGTTGDVGVGIHFNNVPVIVNRTTTAEFFDVERVEVLRGPQGTLYGRNATGGVINVITAKPEAEFGAAINAEYASFNSVKLGGHINVPMGEKFAMRLAGSYLSRDGYTDNLATGNDIDGRDLFSTRLSLAFQPTDAIKSTLVWEHFEEDDSRNGGTRTMCIKDPGPTSVGSTPVTNAAAQLYLSQGCVPGSVYSREALNTPNSVSTFGGRYAYLLGLVPGDVFAGQTLPDDLRDTSFYIDPEYVVTNDIVTFDNEFQLSDALTLNVLASWAEDKLDTRTGSEEANIGFLDTPLTPGGVYTDFQGGPATGIRTLNLNDNYTEQVSAEVRLHSDLDGALNFNVGAFYFDVDRLNHTFISTNSTVLFARASGVPLYFDENPDPDYTGHQYFLSRTPYNLESRAAFGELYWDVTDTVKVTAGARYTEDTKDADATPVMLFVPTGAGGVGTGGWPAEGPGSIQPQTVEFKETTGRLIVDWRPDLSFTDDTMLYASWSRGYKAGGFNSPDDPNDGQSFQPYLPEFVNAFEIGAKNVFMDNRVHLNLTGFYYDYTDYQISLVEQFSLRNTNVDAEVMGVELEMAFEPIDRLTMTAMVGWQDSKILKGSTIDPFDRTQGNPDYTYLSSAQAGCIVPTAALEPLIGLINGGFVPPAILANLSTGPNNDLCEGGYSGAGNPLAAFGVDITPLSGLPADLRGNELAHTPPLSAAFSAQYAWAIGSDWDLTLRGDYTWKDDSYTSHFNGVNYELEAWDNANVSLTFSNLASGLSVRLFAKNVFDDDTFVTYNVAGEGVGSTRGVTMLDPRLFGVAVSARF